MGQDNKRKQLIAIIDSLMDLSTNLLCYYKANATTRKAKLICTKSIKNAQQAKITIREIKHIEILEYLYSILIGNNAIMYSTIGSVVNAKSLREFDEEEHFDEFIKMVEEQKEKYRAKEEERHKQLEALKKAKEEGKKIEYVYDEKTKSAKPLIVEDKPSE